MPTAIRITTEPPITMPAIAPADRREEESPATSPDEVAEEFGDEDIVGITPVAVPVGVEALNPYGSKFLYASQSFLGTASGQESA